MLLRISALVLACCATQSFATSGMPSGDLCRVSDPGQGSCKIDGSGCEGDQVPVPSSQRASNCLHAYREPHDAQFEMGVLFSEGVLVQPVCGGTGRGQQLYIVLNWCHRCSLRHTTLRSASGTKPTNPTPKSVSSNRTRLEARPIPGRCTSMDLGYMHHRCISSGR